MSAYKQQEYDFVFRTKRIIEQYGELELSKEDKFEVTLLINCLVGLLILPQQHWFGNLPKGLISEKEWGISEHHILLIKNGESKSVDEIVRHIRNSVSHYRFKVFDNGHKDISRIKFEDLEYKDGPKTFESTIPISNLRKFILKFSQWFLEEMDKQKPPR